MTASIIDLLNEVPLFDPLTPDEIRLIERSFKLISLPADSVLFAEGDPGTYVCFVIEGELQVLKEGQGRQVPIATLGRGRSIGEMAIIDKFSRSATVRSTRASQLAVLARPDFDALLERFPTVGIKILRSLARLLSLNLRRTSSHLADHLPIGADGTAG